ncbi:MAG TPA: contractile injection system tape measure protein [Burkholderiales bacterium]|nr:contractile injection system tape measure protein [Burkholderiales bacterium]
MTPGVHRVRRQSWRVAVRSAQDAFAARARVRVLVEDELREAFARAFDRAAPGEAVLHIPRLELRLRVASLNGLADALAAALEREIALQRPPPETVREPRADRLQVLLRYLESGVLAWHAAHGEPTAAVSALRDTLLESLAIAVHQAPGGEHAFEHAVQYYFRLLQLLAPGRWVEAAARTQQHESIVDLPALSRWLAARAGDPAPAVHFAAARSVREMVATLATPPAALPVPVAHRLAALLFAALHMPASFLGRIGTSAAVGQKAPSPRDQAKHEQRARAARPQSFPAVEEERAIDEAPAAEIPGIASLIVGNAGLVLLHPFLPRLFDACGFLQKTKLVHLEAAAALLHWLATGREEVFEFELGFVKLLLGLRPETPLAVGERLLGAREREEGEALLGAAIAHWKALGKTSVDGLRVAFLQRRGALREEEDGWRLQLEPESFDVLLGHLPWGLATVKLPWMTRPLYTDWPTP